jgi:hypothetical protein
MAHFPLDVPTTVVFTDPGAEIDDEILLSLLMRTETKKTDIYFVCMPGVTATPDPTPREISDQVFQRMSRLREIFPDKFADKNVWLPDPTSTTTSIFAMCCYEEFIMNKSINNKVQIQTLIHVAPLWHIKAETLLALDIKTRIFMGDLTNPEKSINCTKAMPKGIEGDKLRAEFRKQEEVFASVCEKTIFIPTSFARQVPTPIKFVNSLPSTLTVPLLNTAFKQFVGRPDPSLSWAKDISIVNHATILKMLPSNIMYDIAFHGGSNTFGNDEHENMGARTTTFLANSTDFEYHLRIFQIAQAVLYITKVPYVGNFSEEGLANRDLANQNWIGYINKHNCDLTPFYDGLAWVVMKEGELPAVEKCVEIINGL